MHQGKYWWFGEFRHPRGKSDEPVAGISCYSSTDLYAWRNEGLVLPVVRDDPQHELRSGCVMERPKVVYNRKTGKFVMWFHLELAGQGYRAARCGVAVGDAPAGPYRYLGSFRPDGQMSRDMTLFVDDDEQAYLFTASEENSTMHIHLLSEDYLHPSGRWERIFEKRWMEAPAVFKHKGRYYFIGSDCTGWLPNPARSAVADSIWGPWQERGNPCVGPNANLAFLAQSTFVLPVFGRPGAFIFMADRWRPENPIDSRYVWLPVQFTQDRFVIFWRDEWDLSFFDSAESHAYENRSVAIQQWAPVSAPQYEQLNLSAAQMAWWRDAKLGLAIDWDVGDAADQQFNPRGFVAGRWTEAARLAGARYVIVPVQLRNGLALWDSHATHRNFTSAAGPDRRDLVEEFTQAARQAGLRVGFLHRPVDRRFTGFDAPRQNPKSALLMKAQCYGQARELASLYGLVDLILFDEVGESDEWFWEPAELKRVLREFQPSAVIGAWGGWQFDLDCECTEGDITGPIRQRPGQWFVRLHSPQQCIRQLIRAATRDGNLVVQVNADANGAIAGEQIARLEQIGQWLQRHVESIFNTRGGPWQPVDGVYGSTFRDSTVYVHVHEWVDGAVCLPPIRQRIHKAETAGGPVALEQTSRSVQIVVPPVLRDPICTVVRLELDSPVDLSKAPSTT